MCAISSRWNLTVAFSAPKVEPCSWRIHHTLLKYASETTVELNPFSLSFTLRSGCSIDVYTRICASGSFD
ncbi:hypothetical protein L2E82_20012 [Cichorium intybus]|uniref:Uncharacterized protein n=1 Tax=Cichorium intybus TaxID=13427 RepID=A0ACB9DSG1_CICIN|nr:hypothetical protein L2E82_20012 [Cichorium intybus]